MRVSADKSSSSTLRLTVMQSLMRAPVWVFPLLMIVALSMHVTADRLDHGWQMEPSADIYTPCCAVDTKTFKISNNPSISITSRTCRHPGRACGDKGAFCQQLRGKISVGPLGWASTEYNVSCLCALPKP